MLSKSFNKKRFRKILMIFDLKIDFESQISALFSPPHYTNSQNSMISFDCSWFLAKNLSSFVSLPWKLHNRYCPTLHAKLSGSKFEVNFLSCVQTNDQSTKFSLQIFDLIFSPWRDWKWIVHTVQYSG